jgi:PAS domain S-box-containing protein
MSSVRNSAPAADSSRGLSLQVLPTAAYVCDADGYLIDYNQQAAELWGRAPEPGNDRYCGSYRIFRPDGSPLPHAMSPMAEVIARGASVRNQEVVIERPPGDRIVALLNIDPLRDDFGAVVGAINCFSDVTERKQMQQALLASQQDLEDFFENGVVALHWVGRDGTILRANQAELDLLGYSREEYVGRSITDFHVDRGVIDDILARLSRGEKLDKCPAQLRAKDGTVRHVLISSSTHFQNGEFNHTRCFTLDITDRYDAEVQLRESERRVREMLHALPGAVYTTDTRGSITFYNEAAAQFWGHRPPLGDTQWCGSWRLYRPDGSVLPYDECPMALAIKQGRPIRNVEAIAERPDGTFVHFIAYPTPLRNAAGELIGAVNMLIDIGEIKEAQRRQQLLINELNHRVKNTLATVQSLAHQTFRGDAASAEACHSFETRLLALARTHDVLTKESWTGADLREVITDAVAFVAHAEKRIDIVGPHLRLPPQSIVPLAMGIHELCTNATKYGALSDSSGKVSVSWQIDGNLVVLRWVESGGPPVRTPISKGFGSRLLERGLALELQGSVRLSFPISGVICDVEFPLVV